MEAQGRPCTRQPATWPASTYVQQCACVRAKAGQAGKAKQGRGDAKDGGGPGRPEAQGGQRAGGRLGTRRGGRRARRRGGEHGWLWQAPGLLRAAHAISNTGPPASQQEARQAGRRGPPFPAPKPAPPLPTCTHLAAQLQGVSSQQHTPRPVPHACHPLPSAPTLQKFRKSCSPTKCAAAARIAATSSHAALAPPPSAPAAAPDCCCCCSPSSSAPSSCCTMKYLYSRNLALNLRTPRSTGQASSLRLCKSRPSCPGRQPAANLHPANSSSNERSGLSSLVVLETSATPAAPGHLQEEEEEEERAVGEKRCRGGGSSSAPPPPPPPPHPPLPRAAPAASPGAELWWHIGPPCHPDVPGKRGVQHRGVVHLLVGGQRGLAGACPRAQAQRHHLPQRRHALVGAPAAGVAELLPGGARRDEACVAQRGKQVPLDRLLCAPGSRGGGWGGAGRVRDAPTPGQRRGVGGRVGMRLKGPWQGQRCHLCRPQHASGRTAQWASREPAAHTHPSTVFLTARCY